MSRIKLVRAIDECERHRYACRLHRIFADGAFSRYQRLRSVPELVSPQFLVFSYVSGPHLAFNNSYKLYVFNSHPASDISWIGSIQLAFFFSLAVVAGPLFDKVSHTSRFVVADPLLSVSSAFRWLSEACLTP
jgi:hypothetical protein